MSCFAPVDEEEEQFFSDNSDQAIIEWTNQMDDYYVDLMLEQVRRGNKIGSTFTDHAWAWMVASFNKTFELTCDRDLLESRFFSIKKEYKDAQHMVDQKNMARGGIHQSMVTDNDVCEARIKVCDNNTMKGTIDISQKIVSGSWIVNRVSGRGGSWSQHTLDLDEFKEVEERKYKKKYWLEVYIDNYSKVM